MTTAGGGSTLFSEEYAYDGAGWLHTKTHGGTTTTYGYDPAGQLLTAGSASYGYDPNGVPNTGGLTPGADNQVSSDGTWNYTYNAAGELESKTLIAGGTSWTYVYNPGGQLTTATKTVGGTVTVVVSYLYDVFGTLVGRTETDSGTVVSDVRFAVDGWDTAKPSPTGSENYDTYATLVPDGTGGWTIASRGMFGAGFNQPLAAVSAAGAVNWFVADYQGSVREVIDNSGSVLASATYDAYGNVLSGGVASVTTYGFQGGRLDAATGLINFGGGNGRWYNPVTQQWTSQDPLGLTPGPNASEFVGNGPTDGMDPSGEQATAVRPAPVRPAPVITNANTSGLRPPGTRPGTNVGPGLDPFSEEDFNHRVRIAESAAIQYERWLQGVNGGPIIANRQRREEYLRQQALKAGMTKESIDSILSKTHMTAMGVSAPDNLDALEKTIYDAKLPAIILALRDLPSTTDNDKMFSSMIRLGAQLGMDPKTLLSFRDNYLSKKKSDQYSYIIDEVYDAITRQQLLLQFHYSLSLTTQLGVTEHEAQYWSQRFSDSKDNLGRTITITELQSFINYRYLEALLTKARELGTDTYVDVCKYKSQFKSLNGDLKGQQELLIAVRGRLIIAFRASQNKDPRLTLPSAGATPPDQAVKLADPWDDVWVKAPAGKGWTREDLERLIARARSSLEQETETTIREMWKQRINELLAARDSLSPSAAPKTGGGYGEVRAATKGGDIHHMPADSVSDIVREDGPAIWMETRDHAKTASFDNNPGARAYREKQRQLITDGKMMEAIQMDIDDLRKLFGNKYDESIAQMIEYARRNGFIK